VNERGLSSRRRVLATLRGVRGLGVERASTALAAANDALHEAICAVHAAREAAAIHAARATAGAATDRAGLERGCSTAGDLEATAAWQRRLAAEQHDLLARASATEHARDRAAGEVRKARAGLRACRVQADVVASVIARLDAAAQRASEAAIEQEAAEAWRSRR
jgi:hypothetical protein